MSTMDDRGGGSLETTRVDPPDGDDIVVIPAGPGDPERPSRVRPALALGGIVVALIIAVAIAVVARNHGSKSAIVKTAPTTLATKPIVSAKPHTTTPKKPTAPIVAATTVPHTVPAPAVATAGSVAPPPTSPPPTLPPPPKRYGTSALTWSAPSTLTIASGKTATLAVTAHNPTDGTITLPHPLSCTPRLDHGEMCTEMVQLIPAGQSASAQFTIDAHGIAPGSYTLKIEGVLTVAVTVS